jgi:hypothetical protein
VVEIVSERARGNILLTARGCRVNCTFKAARDRGADPLNLWALEDDFIFAAELPTSSCPPLSLREYHVMAFIATPGCAVSPIQPRSL